MFKRLKLFLVNSSNLICFYYSFKTKEEIKTELEKTTGSHINVTTEESKDALNKHPSYDCRFI